MDQLRLLGQAVLLAGQILHLADDVAGQVLQGLFALIAIRLLFEFLNEEVKEDAMVKTGRLDGHLILGAAEEEADAGGRRGDFVADSCFWFFLAGLLDQVAQADLAAGVEDQQLTAGLAAGHHLVDLAQGQQGLLVAGDAVRRCQVDLGVVSQLVAVAGEGKHQRVLRLAAFHQGPQLLADRGGVGRQLRIVLPRSWVMTVT